MYLPVGYQTKLNLNVLIMRASPINIMFFIYKKSVSVFYKFVP